MLFTADPGQRQEFICGLQELAAFLDSNPDVPVPVHGTSIVLHTSGPDTEMFAAVDRIAAMLGMPPRQSGHYTATRSFGPIEYRAVAIPAAWEADYQARHSYDGSITLADTTEPAVAV